MKYTIITTGSVLVMVLIMTLSPAQSMEMTTSHELAESGIMIDFTKNDASSSLPPKVTGAPHKTQTVASPPRDQVRFELAESGHTLIFTTDDDPARPAPGPIRTIAKPYLETPAPLAGTPYHTRHTFEMAESGQIIVFRDMPTASPEVIEHDVVVGKRIPPTTPDTRQDLEPHVN